VTRTFSLFEIALGYGALAWLITLTVAGNPVRSASAA